AGGDPLLEIAVVVAGEALVVGQLLRPVYVAVVAAGLVVEVLVLDGQRAGGRGEEVLSLGACGRHAPSALPGGQPRSGGEHAEEREVLGVRSSHRHFAGGSVYNEYWKANQMWTTAIPAMMKLNGTWTFFHVCRSICARGTSTRRRSISMSRPVRCPSSRATRRGKLTRRNMARRRNQRAGRRRSSMRIHQNAPSRRECSATWAARARCTSRIWSAR